MKACKNKLFAVLWTLLACILSLAVFAACTGNASKSVTLDKRTASVGIGETVELVPTVVGGDIADLEWTSSDETVATVSEGIVTGVSEGEAIIKAILGNVEASCTVTVTSNIVPTIVLDRTEMDLVIGGDSVTVNAGVRYGGETVTADIVWTSADPAIATVENGTVTPVAEGTTTIRATAEYRGKPAEASLKVTVKSDAYITLSTTDVTLYTYAVEGFATTAEITAEAFIGGNASAGTVVTFSTEDNDVVAIAVNGNTVTVTAKMAGTTDVTASFENNGKTISATVKVKVVRTVLTIDEEFTANLFDTNAVLDFSTFDWADEVSGLYYNGTPVSVEGNPAQLDPAWLEMRAAGTTAKVIVALGNYDVEITVRFANDYRTLAYTLPEGGIDGSSITEFTGDKTAYGFAEKDTVYLWHAAGDNWLDRIHTVNLSTYDYWVVEFTLTTDIKAEIDFWIAGNHVIQVLPDGNIYMYEAGPNFSGTADDHAKNSCLTIYDAEGKLYFGTLKAGEKYIVEMDLAHHGRDFNFCEIGTAFATDVYLGNSFACTRTYYETYVAPSRDKTVEESYEFTVEKTIAETWTLDISAYDWASKFEGLYEEDVRITESGKAVLLESWISAASSGWHLLTLKLTDGTALNARLYVANSIVSFAYYLPDGGAELTTTRSGLLGLGFGARDTVQEYNNLNNTSNWTNRLSADTNISSYDWWVFDFVLDTDLFNGNGTQDVLVFWIGSGHVLMIKDDGSISLYQAGGYAGSDHNSENCMHIYNPDGTPLEGKMLPRVKYTFEISLAHKGSLALFEIGAYFANTHYWIGNSFACTDEYHEKYVAPNRGNVNETLEFVVEKQFPDTHTLEVDTYEWKDNVAGVYEGEERISEENSTRLLADWIASAAVGEHEIVIRLKNGAEYYAILTVANTPNYENRRDLEYWLPEPAGDSFGLYEGEKTQYGFAEDDTVYLWHAVSNAWNDRLRAINLSAYDYWIIEMTFTAAPTAEIDFWIANNHVVQILDGGNVFLHQGGPNYGGSAQAHAKDSCLTVYDAQGKLYRGLIEAGKKYIFEISLAHHGNNFDLCDFGVAFATDVYVGNTFACTKGYYDANIAATRDLTDDTAKFTIEKNSSASWTLDLSSYGAVEGIYEKETCISEGAKLLDSWVAAAGIYGHYVTVKLANGNSFGAIVYVEENLVQVGYQKSGSLSNVESVADPEAHGFNAGDVVYKYTNGNTGDHWSDRMGTSRDIGAFNWWIFDIVVETEAFSGDGSGTAFILWIGSGHVMQINNDGSVSLTESGANYAGGQEQHAAENCIRIYKQDGTKLEGNMQKGIRYTIEIDLSHKGNSALYEIGASIPNTELYIGNSYACTTAYYNANVAPTHNK